MLIGNWPGELAVIVPRFMVPITAPLVLFKMAIPAPAAGAGEAARLTSRRCPVFGLYARPRSVEPAVTQVLLTAAVDQTGVMILATVKNQELVRRLESLSVKARETKFD